MRIVKHVEGGIVRRVVLVDDSGAEVGPVTRFLDHLADSGYSPNTLCGYGYDLRRLAEYIEGAGLSWDEFTPARCLQVHHPPTKPELRLSNAFPGSHG